MSSIGKRGSAAGGAGGAGGTKSSTDDVTIFMILC